MSTGFGPRDVRTAAEYVARTAQRVHINTAAIDAWAEAVDPARIQPAPRPAELRFQGSPDEIARWVLLLDALNFCFWSDAEPGWSIDYRGRTWSRYGALVAALHRAVAEDRRWLQPDRWADATADDLERLFAGGGRIPLLEERRRILNETGCVALDRWHGEPIRLAEEAQFDASRLVFLVVESFPSFRDVPTYGGVPTPLLKRAQILAADLAETWGASGGPAMDGLASLTAFADYRIPQVLRHLHILRLESALEAAIEARQLVERSSPEEVEIRACSIHAVELMCRALGSRKHAAVPAWRLDEYLWARSHDADVAVQHHRTLSSCY